MDLVCDVGEPSECNCGRPGPSVLLGELVSGALERRYLVQVLAHGLKGERILTVSFYDVLNGHLIDALRDKVRVAVPEILNEICPVEGHYGWFKAPA